MVCIFSTGHLAYLHCNGIGHQRALLCICQQNPALALGEPERLHLTGKFQAIGFLRIAPRRVATTFNLHRILEIVVHAIAVYAEFGLEVGALACHEEAIIDIYVNTWHPCYVIGEPVHIHIVDIPERNAAVLINGILYLHRLLCSTCEYFVYAQLGEHTVVFRVLAARLLYLKFRIAAAQGDGGRCILLTRATGGQIVVGIIECAH